MAQLHRLDGGVEVLIRPIRPSDKGLLSRGLANLSLKSAYARFLSPKPRFTTEELRYLTEVDAISHVALVAVAADDPSRLAGVGRYVRLKDDPGTAEIAIVVADDLQGQGLGNHLGVLLTEHARAGGIKRFVAHMLSDNVPAHRLFQRISANLTTEHDSGVDLLSVPLAA